MFIRCRVTSRILMVPRSMTKEEWAEEVLEAVAEVEDLVEAVDRLFSTIVEHRDTTHDIVPILPLHVSIVGLMIMLLKNSLFFKLRCRTRDHGWVIRMSS